MSEARAALASHALALLAIDPLGLGGACLRGPASPVRETWLAALETLSLASLSADRARLGHEQTPWRRVPPGVSEGRLIGGLDLAATLAAGRPVAERGLLAAADGGTLVVPMAERLAPGVAGLIAAALDTGEVLVERDSLAARAPARFSILLLDEGEGDEHAPAALVERAGLVIDLACLRPADVAAPDPDVLVAARAALPRIVADEEVMEALAAAGLAFGVPSLRIASLALRTARAAAAFAGRTSVARDDAELAAALVIAPRATCLPAAPEEAPDDETPEDRASPEPDAGDIEEPGTPGETVPLADSVVEATRAAIPADLLALLGAATAGLRPSGGGRGGPAKSSPRRGRPAGTRRGQPGHGVRLALVDTLRAAAPWQRLRRQTAPVPPPPGRLLIRRDDFRIARFKERSESVTIFVVDASGSAALHRLAEVKGAVELILAECYVRRDSVALVAFRGAGAELILPPTRSLARAKRALAGQAGGGGTPLAAAIEAATLLADRVRRDARMPNVVLLTDGKANIARSGAPGRAAAEADALAAAQAFREAGLPGLVLDIAPRPSEQAGRLASVMGARYIPLPYADAQAMSRIVMATDAIARGNV